MTDYQEKYDRIGQMLRLISPFYRRQVAALLFEYGNPDNWFALNAVHASEPSPFAVQEVQRRAPYSSLERQSEIYSNLAANGYLDSHEKDTYILTESGRQLIEGFFTAAHKSLSDENLLPEKDAEQLADFLGRLVEAACNQPEPVEKLALSSSRRTDPGAEYPPLVRIDQYVTDLVHFRDDAHTAAWQRYELDGRAWETLSMLWREEVQSAADLVERLGFRGFSQEDYQQSLDELLERGLLVVEEGSYRISDEGKRIREEAEAETDRLFYGGWSVLSEDELLQLNDLLVRTNERLEEHGTVLFWTIATELAQAIPAAAQTAVQDPFNEYFKDPAVFFPTLLASGKSPESYSVADHNGRYPYINPIRVKEVLDHAVVNGLLASSNGGYIVTGKGWEALDTVNDIFYRRLDEIASSVEANLQDLADKLQRIVNASLQAPEPENKSALEIMHHCHPETEYGPLARIDQSLDDLNAFRDDCHISAWKTYEVDARSWETFTLVWRGDATSVSDLVEKLSQRGYGEVNYLESLEKLVELGWLAETDGVIQTTNKGRAVREEAEARTNQLFFDPWECLNIEEKNRLRDLLIQIRLELVEIGDAQPTEVV